MNMNTVAVGKGPNEAKYAEIYKKKAANPNTPLVKLCEDAGTSYQSYNNWLKKQTKEQTVSNKLRVTVHVSVRNIVDLINGGVNEVPITLESLIRSLHPDDRKRLAEEIGMTKLEGLSKPATGQN